MILIYSSFFNRFYPFLFLTVLQKHSLAYQNLTGSSVYTVAELHFFRASPSRHLLSSLLHHSILLIGRKLIGFEIQFELLASNSLSNSDSLSLIWLELDLFKLLFWLSGCLLDNHLVSPWPQEELIAPKLCFVSHLRRVERAGKEIWVALDAATEHRSRTEPLRARQTARELSAKYLPCLRLFSRGTEQRASQSCYLALNAALAYSSRQWLRW